MLNSETIGISESVLSGVEGLQRIDGYRFAPPILQRCAGWVEAFCADTHRSDCIGPQLYVPAVANYRRNKVAGGSFFFTVNVADRRSSLLVDKIELIRSAFRAVSQHHPFSLDAIVVLPEHLRCIWTLPAGDADFATRWRLIKSEFSKHIAPGEGRSPSRAAKGERGIWQRRYWEHTLRDERDFERHCDYIHFNPVKHGHVTRAADWPFSSFKRFIRLGVYTSDWGDSGSDDHADYGERRDL